MDQFLRPSSQILVSWKSGSCCVNFLSLFLTPPSYYFQAEFPSGAWRLTTSTYLPWLQRPKLKGAQGGVPSTI